MFIDEVVVEFTSGNGGSGAVSFHREKHVPRGGPNGADGGRGGGVILIADRGCRTLYDLHLRRHVEAENGTHALGNKRGSNGKDISVKVPVGTVVYDDVLGDQLADLSIHGMKVVLCRGGRGGHGNLHYVSSVRQVPNFAEKGEPGETIRGRLELKLLADIGLIGLPNAGKSTLISQISAAKPKIASYPFTTIVPNLGVAQVADQSFVVADMPGLIEGASLGKGLGHQFLKHIERTKVLVHIVDLFPIDESDPYANYELIEREIADYSQDIAARPRIVALNKIDLGPAEAVAERAARFANLGVPVFQISGATRQGIEPLLYRMAEMLVAAEAEAPMPTLMPAKTVEVDDSWDVVEAEDGYEVVGRKVLRMTAMTDLNNKDAVRYLHRRLNRMGVIDRLRELGAKEDDTVYIGDAVFAFTDWS